MSHYSRIIHRHSGGNRRRGEGNESREKIKTDWCRASHESARYRRLQFEQRKGDKYFCKTHFFCPRMRFFHCYPPHFVFFFFNKWFSGDKGNLSRQPERTLAAGQGDGWAGDIQLGRTGCVFVWRMTVWTPNNCPLASADLLSEVYFGKSHFLPLHKGYRPHLGKCDFDETFISGAPNRTKGREDRGGKSVGSPPSSPLHD